MAAILLDVDGVLHVSGDADRRGRRRRAPPARGRAPPPLRDELHDPLARAARRAAAGMGIELDDDEFQTTAASPSRALKGKRVLALTMPGILDDLDGLQLVGMNVDAVLIGGADEGEETGRIFSYLNLNRAFHELEAGAELYCLHKNRWWQTADGARLDTGVFVAGLEYAADIEATVLGKPSAAYFAAALEALDADPGLAWMVGDDLEGDIIGAQKHGMRTVLVRTGKFRPDEVERSPVQPDGIISSIAQLPDWLERIVKVGVDLIEIERIRRALDRHGDSFKERCFTDAERAYCDSKPNPPQHYAGRFAAKEAIGKALGSGVYFTWKEIEVRGRPKPGVHLSGRTAAFAERVGAGTIELSMTHSRELAAAIAVALPA